MKEINEEMKGMRENWAESECKVDRKVADSRKEGEVI